MQVSNWSPDDVQANMPLCASLSHETGKWSAQDCNATMSYICKVTKGLSDPFIIIETIIEYTSIVRRTSNTRNQWALHTWLS